MGRYTPLRGWNSNSKDERPRIACWSLCSSDSELLHVWAVERHGYNRRRAGRSAYTGADRHTVNEFRSSVMASIDPLTGPWIAHFLVITPTVCAG